LFLLPWTALTNLFANCVQTIYYHFRRWRLDGRLRRAHDALRAEVRAREGRARDPSAAVIDSQAVKTS
jgi:transposase